MDCCSNSSIMSKYPSYLDTVGKTPLVAINSVLTEEAKHATVLCKLEMQNPGGSIKDRIAMKMVEDAEKSGKLKPGMTVIEPTSGNTGIGVAMVCAAKGYKCIIVMPQVPPMLERVMICRMFGAEVRLTCPGKGFKGLLEHVHGQIAKEPDKYYFPNQFSNESNPDAHYDTTGKEIWEQTSGDVDIFIHGIGTGGCISGVGKYLKEKKESVKVIAIEPSNARVHVGEAMNPHTIVGLAPGMPSEFLTGPFENEDARGVVDEWAHCHQDDAVVWAKKACSKEGMMIGPSAGAALKVAIDVASRPDSKGKTIVVVFSSHGIRYTAHPLWKEVKAEAISALPVPPNMNKEAPTLLWSSDDP